MSFVSQSSAPPPINRRLALATLGLGVFAPGLLAACGGTGSKQAEKKETPAAHVKFQPADAADNVVPIAPISVEVSDGWFQHVTLTNSSGKPVAGAFNQDRTVYTTTEPLGYETTYT
ncbi:Ig-like domain-containing protein, partial [Mycobacterium sp.]|uniref:Ig-like domain-containing protein n=1 Tax=Mycobacterium sp. TaxID=1785 RepID=UPI0025D38EB9